MKKATLHKLTPEQQSELDALAKLPDEQIDTADIPEIQDWSKAERGAFYRPVKQQITLRLDADLIAWFKTHDQVGKRRGYQTSINHALREYVTQHATKKNARRK